MARSPRTRRRRRGRSTRSRSSRSSPTASSGIATGTGRPGTTGSRSAATFSSDPAVSSSGADRIDVWAPGRDGRVWHRWWDGTRWVEWEQLGPMSDQEIRLGALCWNQYTDWPALLEAGRRADRLGLPQPVDVGPPLPDRRQLQRADPRGLAADGGVGPGDRTDPDRADGRREHVPQPGARREDGDHARPPQQRPGDPRHRRRLVRGGARGVRAGVRVGAARAPALARRGAADHARHARRHGADSARAALRIEGDPEPAGASPGPPADLRRRRRRAGHAQARRPVRGHEQRRRRHRQRAAQGGDPAAALRDGRARPVDDRAVRRARAGVHPRQPCEAEQA